MKGEFIVVIKVINEVFRMRNWKGIVETLLFIFFLLYMKDCEGFPTYGTQQCHLMIMERTIKE